MSKKLITACMGLVALGVFILPAAASASPVVTHPTGTTLSVAGTTCTGNAGICITATNIGELTLWDTAHKNPLTHCTKATMTGWLSKNTDTEIEGTIHSASFSGTGPNGECTSTFGGITVDTNLGNGTPWCLKAEAGDTFSVRGNSCTAASRSITFALTSTTVGTCKYQRANGSPVKGTFQTHAAGDAILDVNPTSNAAFTLEEGGIFCPASGTLDMTFTLETDSVTPEPLYIS
jgi:hypothetical protein